MESRMKLRFPRFLLSTLTSCKSQDSDDVIQQQHSAPASSSFSPKSVLLLDSQVPHSSTSIEPLLPNHHSSYDQCPSSAICKPRCPGTFDQMVRENCILPVERRRNHNYLPGKRNPLFAPYSTLSDLVSREMKSSCPPGPPPASSPFTHYYYTKLDNNNNKKKKKKKKKQQRNNNKPEDDKPDKNVGSRSHRRRRRRRRRTHSARFGGKVVQPFRYQDWLNTDDEDDEREEQSDYDTDSLTDTLFSSSRSFLSLSSSKSVSYSSDYSDAADGTRRRIRRGGRRRQHNRTQRKIGGGTSEVGPVPLEAKVKGSFAVVKSSSDPYNDFQTSMVEMIMEKQIFGEKELQQLFQCFLSLNSSKHHRVIAEVFADICAALFHK